MVPMLNYVSSHPDRTKRVGWGLSLHEFDLELSFGTR